MNFVRRNILTVIQKVRGFVDICVILCVRNNCAVEILWLMLNDLCAE